MAAFSVYTERTRARGGLGVLLSGFLVGFDTRLRLRVLFPVEVPGRHHRR